MNETTMVTPAEAREEALGVLADRSSSYRMFSRLFLSPLSAGEVDSLAAAELEKMAAEMGEGSLLYEGLNDMGRGLHRRHTGTQRLLSTDFTMCFDGISALNDVRAVPYASVFIGSKTGDKAELFQEPRKADRAAYRKERICIDSDLNLPDDHLSFEMSFMADLSDKAAQALSDGDVEEALRLLDVSDDFRVGHILSWYGLFFDLASQIVETRFSRGVLKATYGYLQVDAETTEGIRDLLLAG